MASSTRMPVSDTLSLAGPWTCRLASALAEVSPGAPSQEATFQVRLPGSLGEQGGGEDISLQTPWVGEILDRRFFTAPAFEEYRQPGRLKVPFWLQPERYFSGVAWYERDVEIPEAWRGRRVVLVLERAHWSTQVWLDGLCLGSRDSLSVPHTYELGLDLAPGRHVLRIQVDNTMLHQVGVNSHSISDHTQGNWNGLIGTLELRAGAPVWLGEVQLYPSSDRRTLRVRAGLHNCTGNAFRGNLDFLLGSASGGGQPGLLLRTACVCAGESQELEFSVRAPDLLAPWCEFSPVLHEAELRLTSEDAPQVLLDQRSLRFGVRELRTEGRQLLLNGRPLFLRGTLECGAFPLTGYPPTDVESWKREFRIVLEHGLNHVRFHSWCPPEAAFVAADELGLYLQIEAASWPTELLPLPEGTSSPTFLGTGVALEAYLEAESRRILAAYGNHPSFLFFCACNEPGGTQAAGWLDGWVTRRRSEDSRRLYTAGAGWPATPANQYEIPSEPRIQHWLEGLQSRINRLAPETRSDYSSFIQSRQVPVVSHEIGQWCVYPNYREIETYTGLMKPRNLESFQASLVAHQMADQAADFLKASGRLQVLCYKEEIESALRTPGMGGFQLLGLNDFPGQGTALVGVLDVFWQGKGYVSPTEFRRFCHHSVVLARLDKRVFTQAERLCVELELAHFGSRDLTELRTQWRLVDSDQRVWRAGELGPVEAPVGAARKLGHLDLSLDGLPAPAAYKLVAGVEALGIENDWDLWLYPSQVQTNTETVLEVQALDADSVAQLAAGATLWLALPPGQVRQDEARGRVELGFSSIFWNTSWTAGQAPHTLGILCDPEHPCFAQFPTEAHSNWQWWYPLQQASVMLLDGFPAELRPLVQVIDDWNTNRRLALAFEAKLGRGRVLVTSLELPANATDPVRRQLRASLLAYLSSESFRPTVCLEEAQLRRLVHA